MGASGGILMDRDQCRNPSTLGVDTAHQMARALGRDHDHIDIVRRKNGFEMNAKSMGNSESLARSQACPDRRLEKVALGLIRSQDLDPVGALGGLGWGDNLKAIRLR